MRFFLMGFMGCGKSSLGKKLASNLNMDFIDLDEKIEQLNNASVPDLFEQGEDYFRMVESKTLLSCIEEYDSCLIALGGGTPCYNENLNIILNHGFSIYIQMSPEALYSRLKHRREGRPMIRDLDDDTLLSFIRSTLDKRETFYDQAHMKVDGLSLKGERLKVLAEELAQISST